MSVCNPFSFLNSLICRAQRIAMRRAPVRLRLWAMRPFFVVVCVFLQVTAYGACDRCRALDNGCGQPSAVLLEVLETFGIMHDGTWPCIQAATERAWLSHGRNVDLQDIPPIPDVNLERTYSLFTRLGMTQTFSPEETWYDYGVVLGSWAPIVRQRLWFLKKAWDSGVRFSTLVFLTGDRPLDPKIESEKALTDPACSPYPFREGWTWKGPLPENETGMMLLMFDQLALPPEWRTMTFVVADAPKPPGFTRPHTEHTLIKWLEMHPQPGTMLVISDQPFICRQEEVLKPFLPLDFEMETVGAGFPFERLQQEPRGTAILLAELAYRIKLYCETVSTRTGSACLSSAPCL